MIDRVNFKLQVQMGMYGNLVAYLPLNAASLIKLHEAQSSCESRVILNRTLNFSSMVSWFVFDK